MPADRKGEGGEFEEPPGIRFTQYLMPDGRTRPQWVERPPEIEALAARLTECGACFEIEMLRDTTISMTCERDNEDGEIDVLAHELCPNGPAVPLAVDRLVNTATVEFSRLKAGSEERPTP